MNQDHPNATVTRDLWSAIADGDAARVESILSSDIVWISHGRHPLSGEYHGSDEVLGYLARLGERAEDLRTTLRGIYTNDHGSVLIYRVEAARPGKRLDVDFFLQLTIEEGRVSRAESVPLDQQRNDAFWS